jgi:hypothetical protein
MKLTLEPESHFQLDHATTLSTKPHLEFQALVRVLIAVANV